MGARQQASPGKSGGIGRGRLLLWRGGSAWLGRETGQAVAHAHHAIQVTLAPRHAVRLRNNASEPWLVAAGVMVMPHQPHEFDGQGSEVVLLFVEPETTAGRALIARAAGAGLSSVADAQALQQADTLLRACQAGADDSVLLRDALDLVERLAGNVAAPAAIDRRVTAALDWVHAHLDAPISLAQAAAVAHLSPSRFRHLFVAQTGISFRAYLLWSRVRSAIAQGLAGGSWTDAAQQAGFADSAHLSRTCRRMFGIAPTALGRD
jgi:AraC-like DNA-binding protein